MTSGPCDLCPFSGSCPDCQWQGGPEHTVSEELSRVRWTQGGILAPPATEPPGNAHDCLCCAGQLTDTVDPRRMCDHCLGQALAGIRHQHTEER